MKTESKLPVISPFVLLPEASAMAGCPKTTILKYSRLGQFPPIVRLLGNRIAFVRADVEQWIDNRLTQSNERAA